MEIKPVVVCMFERAYHSTVLFDTEAEARAWIEERRREEMSMGLAEDYLNDADKAVYLSYNHSDGDYLDLTDDETDKAWGVFKKYLQYDFILDEAKIWKTRSTE